MIKTDNLVGFLKTATESGKGITFLKEGGKEKFLAYDELFIKASIFLANLRRSGMGKGDRLILQVEDSPAFLTLFWACLMGGIVPVPLSPATTDEYRLKLLKVCDILGDAYIAFDEHLSQAFDTYLIDQATNDLRGLVREKTILHKNFNLNCVPAQGGMEQIKPEDLAYIQFSSGSTGDPKGILLTHDNLLNNIHAFLGAKQTDSNDVYLTWLPLTHDMGLIGWHLNPLVAGVNQYIMPPKIFVNDPGLWFDKISEHRVSIISTPSFGLNHVLKFAGLDKKNWDLSCVRLIVTGADPISHTLCHQFLDTMAVFGLGQDVLMPGYGLAEATLAVCVSPVGKSFITHYLDVRSLGVGNRVADLGEGEENAVPYVDEGPFINGFEARICDKENRDLGASTIGHIQLKSPSITSGYVNRPGATTRAFTRDGWLKTGDLGFIRNGRIVITGRTKEIIIINGMNFYPHDIERVAGQVPELKGCSVVACGAYDKHTLSEELVLFVSFKKEIEAFVPLVPPLRDQVASQLNLPLSRVIPIRSIPRTTSGKVKRVRLADLYHQGVYTPLVNQINQLLYARLEKIDLSGLPREKRLGIVIEFICDQVSAMRGVPVIDPQISLTHHGVDSLMGIELRNCIETTFGISLPVSWFRTDETLVQFSKKILTRYQEQGILAFESVQARTDIPLLDQLKHIEQMSEDQIREMIQTIDE